MDVDQMGDEGSGIKRMDARRTTVSVQGVRKCSGRERVERGEEARKVCQVEAAARGRRTMKRYHCTGLYDVSRKAKGSLFILINNLQQLLL